MNQSRILKGIARGFLPENNKNCKAKTESTSQQDSSVEQLQQKFLNSSMYSRNCGCPKIYRIVNKLSSGGRNESMAVRKMKHQQVVKRKKLSTEGREGKCGDYQARNKSIDDIQRSMKELCTETKNSIEIKKLSQAFQVSSHPKKMNQKEKNFTFQDQAKRELINLLMKKYKEQENPENQVSPCIQSFKLKERQKTKVKVRNWDTVNLFADKGDLPKKLSTSLSIKESKKVLKSKKQIVQRWGGLSPWISEGES